MAQYTPKSWTAVSPAASRVFRERYTEIFKLVQQKARKYFNLSSISQSDLVQEGLIAALYAVDSYNPARGKMDAYIGTNVNNAMMMILAESRAQCRQPYTWVKAEDDQTPDNRRRIGKTAPSQTEAPRASGGKPAAVPVKPVKAPKDEHWRRVPAMDFADPDTVQHEVITPLEQREAEIERMDRAAAARARLAEVRAALSPKAKLVFDTRCEPPADLYTIARNLSGRIWNETQKLPNNAIAQYLSIKPAAVDLAMREIKMAVLKRYSLQLLHEVWK